MLQGVSLRKLGFTPSEIYFVLTLLLLQTNNIIITIGWYVEFRPETTAVVRHSLGMTVELTHCEGIVGDQLIAIRELVHTLGHIGSWHPLHLIHLNRHAGGFVGGQAGAVLIRSGYCTDVRNIINNFYKLNVPHYGS